MRPCHHRGGPPDKDCPVCRRWPSDAAFAADPPGGGGATDRPPDFGHERQAGPAEAPLVRCTSCTKGTRFRVHGGMRQADLEKLIDGPVPEEPWPRGWHLWPVAAAAHQALFARTRDRLLDAQASPLPGGSGRGVVTCGGGSVYFGAAYVMISVLRRLGCPLPVEVWHIGPHEMDGRMARVIEALGGVTVRDCLGAEALATPLGRPRKMTGWESKCWAVLHSAFEEVLFLDADQVPQREPTCLFDCDEYQAWGAVLWPDLCNHLGYDVTETAFKVAGLAVPPGRQPRTGRPTGYRPVESGQLLVHKGRHWRSLLLAWHVCEHSDFWWPGPGVPWHVYGDKSAFYLGFEAVGQGYAMPPDCGWVGNSRSGAFLQKDFKGEVVFAHKCQPTTKWSLHGVNHPCQIKHFGWCVEALHGLRALWPGHPYDAADGPDISGTWLACPERGEPSPVVLHPGGRADGVADADRWAVASTPAGERLVFSNSRRAVSFFEPGGMAEWTGPGGPLIRSMPTGWQWRDRRDLEVFNGVCTANEYKLPARLDGMRVLDVGGHVGSFAHACLLRGAAHVTVFEPNADNARTLYHNLQASWPGRFTLWPCAAWVRRETLLLSFPDGADHSGGGSVLCGQGSPVLALPLEEVLAGRRFDLMKLDCEGAEWHLLAHYGTRYAQVVVGEYHEAALAQMTAGLRGGLPEAAGADWLARAFDFETFAHPAAAGLGWFRSQGFAWAGRPGEPVVQS